MTNNWSQDAAVGVSRGQGLPSHTHHQVKISTDFSMSKIYLLHLEVDFRWRRFFLYVNFIFLFPPLSHMKKKKWPIMVCNRKAKGYRLILNSICCHWKKVNPFSLLPWITSLNTRKVTKWDGRDRKYRNEEIQNTRKVTNWDYKDQKYRNTELQERPYKLRWQGSEIQEIQKYKKCYILRWQGSERRKGNSSTNGSLMEIAVKFMHLPQIRLILRRIDDTGRLFAIFHHCFRLMK